MGMPIQGDHLFLPEESIWLAETALGSILHNGVPLSVQQSFHLLERFHIPFGRQMDNQCQMQRKAPLFKYERATYERLEKFISEVYFTDCNLRSHLYGNSKPIKIKHRSFGYDCVSPESAIEMLITQAEEVIVGFEFGPTWSTHWFQLDIDIPQEFANATMVLRFDAGCEALLWNEKRLPVQGFSPDFGRKEFLLGNDCKQRFYVEASANCRNGDGDGQYIQPANLDKSFKIRLADIIETYPIVNELLIDFEVMLQMSKLLSKDGCRRYEALYTANDLVNRLIASDFSNHVMEDCHREATKFFYQKNGASQMTLYAIGNCHIDTAWLWRFQETKRKCARSWISSFRLMETNSKMVFALSQAQQLSWFREQYPSAYEELRDFVADGRIVGVGGSWVEMDGNLPSGESMIRQLLYGQREFLKVFGKYCDVFWLPDTFGYSAQMPQIIKHCGMLYFVTQKMSWSWINKFPHHSFRWHGLDGTEILTHFLPHHYVSQITVKECIESAKTFNDRGRSRIAMMLYGHGDGGGGPDEQMLRRAERLKDCDGVPRVVHSAPSHFFEMLENDAKNLCVWHGELYLELHNATYTTQAELKKLNRLMEYLLREHEFLQVVKLIMNEKAISFCSQWKNVLLNQFHDILPGTCIKEVVKDSKQIYYDLLNELVSENGNCLRKVTNRGDGQPSGNFHRYSEINHECDWIVNSSGWVRSFYYNHQLFEVPSLSVVNINRLQKLELIVGSGASVKHDGYYFYMENRYVLAKINQVGQLVSLVLKTVDSSKKKFNSSNEFLVKGQPANVFVIFDDVPLYWDAWDVMDYHLETRKEIKECISAEIITNDQEFAEIRFKVAISATSIITQDISIRADLPFITFRTVVNWNESHKFLKVEFPFNLRCDEAVYDIQFGHVKRPSHRNTSWDSAKYEVCGHNWMAVSEYDRGLALLNNCKYGYACDANIMRLSLLRSSKSPDETADIGQHEFSYALYPFTGSMQRPSENMSLSVMKAAYEINNPIRFIDGWESSEDFICPFEIEGSDGIFIDAIKLAEDEPEAFILRVHECFGGSCHVRLILSHARLMSVDLVDGLERISESLFVERDSAKGVDYVHLEFRAFELKTLLIRLAAM